MPENKNKDIELRSEKVRNIVGKVPPLLLRTGIFIISIIITLVLTLAYFIPYPEYEDITVCLYSDPPVHTVRFPQPGHGFIDRNVIIPDSILEIYGVCSIPYDEINKIREGQKVSVTIDNMINGYVRQISPFVDLDSLTGKTFYRVEIAGFPDSLRKCEDKRFLYPNKKYNGRILLSEKSILKKILGIN